MLHAVLPYKYITLHPIAYHKVTVIFEDQETFASETIDMISLF